MNVGARLVPATVFLVLGGGFVALALGYGWYWWVWLLGYAVVLPLVAVLTGPDAPPDPPVPPGPGDDEQSEHREDAAESTQDALDTLRERYARGELSDEQFERKVERLVGTETPEDAELAVGGADDAPGADESANGREQAAAREPERE